MIDHPLQRVESAEGRNNPVNTLAGRVTIRRVDDIRDAALAMHEMAQARGFRVAACDDISSKEPMVDADGAIINGEIFGWMADGERWWEDTRLALNSPLPRACRYESEPFWCNETGMFGRWRNEYLEEMDLTDFYKRSLCHAAIMVPIHLPFGQIGSVSFTPLDKELTDLSEPFEKHADLMAAMTRRFIAGYVMVMRTKRRIPSDCMLSKREVECLRWAAIGKTDKEISMILGRSHATIRYHIHRAGEKLDAVNRSQTIFKAGQLGYLGASD
ncbi:LuxR C-terminal-related transcriptional regulator [Blastomonas sp.]|uniref:helix-turn-helix transcriptional regulator n=1 Tax=Blastomonas sp. TaxID=1909299 RepID=UPI003593E801